MESLERIQEQLKKGLSELENLFKKAKDVNDAEVKAIEEHIRLALDVPQESWAPKGQSLKDLIDNISRNIQDLQNSSHQLQWISDKDVLKNASGGLCLEGVYKTGKFEDLLDKREQLIEIPESFSLRGPEQSTMYNQKEFSSSRSESVFQKAIEKLGFTFTCASKVSYWGFGIENTTERSQSTGKEEKSSHSSEQSHIFNMKYNYIPLASSFIERDQLRLSQGAINALKEIEVLLNSTNREALKDRVMTFFEGFGSHANQGPIHFGGVFCWMASAEGVNSSDLSEIKSLTSDALNVYVGAGYSSLNLNISAGVKISSSELKGFFTREHNEGLMNQVHLSIRKTGGPAEFDDHLKWKAHLAKNNRTWSVIDRGTSFVPVWEIVMSAHREVFRDTVKLSTTLKKIFEDFTEQNVKTMQAQIILSAIERANVMIQSVKDWKLSDSDFHLAKLLDLKIKLKHETDSHNIWIHTCLSSQLLQDYFVKVVNANKAPTAIHQRFLMRVLLEPLPDGLHFPNRSKIMKWAYQSDENPARVSVSDFHTLISNLKQIREELEDAVFLSSTKLHHAKVNANCKVTLSINSLCHALREKKEEEAELLVLLILDIFGYKRQNKTFDHLMDSREIGLLQTKISDGYEKYSSLKQKSLSKAQAYLILTALTLSLDDGNVPSHKITERLDLIQSQLKNTLSDNIEFAIEGCHSNWEILKREVLSIIDPSLEKKNINQKNVETQLNDLLTNRVVAFSEETCIKSEPCGENVMDSFTNLLQKLGINAFYTKKMQLKDILVINNLAQNVHEPNTEEQLTSLYLYKLMMLDYRARYLFINPEETDSISEDTTAIVDDEDFFSIDHESSVNIQHKISHIHPMDIHMAVFHCANDFLRQYIFTKLTACQFALPFLVPNPCTGAVEFPLWPLRNIKKTWRSTAQSNTDNPGKYKSRQMFSTLVPFVSFIRLGTSSNSKSQILNAVISKQKHNVFFNRHCTGSTPNSLLMSGVVEIAWYCPGGRKDDIFDDCVSFLNLHGDAKENPEQLQFLQAVSTVIVVLLPEHPQDDEKHICQSLLKSSIPLICLFSGQETISASKNPVQVRLAAKNRNEAELTEELIKHIKQCIARSDKRTSIKMCLEEARKRQFSIDEEKSSLKNGFAQAQSLVCILKEGNISTIKQEFLPLQSQLWHSWCKLNKEQYRLHSNAKESLEVQKSRIRVEMKAMRKKQLEKATPLNDFMRSFLDCLTSEHCSEDTKFYMLQWLKILLDELIADPFAKLEEDYHSSWTKMKKLFNSKEKACELDQLKKQLNAISVEMTAMTVGLQHIMREAGQLYEAVQSKTPGDSLTQNVDALPAIGAEMLISGHALELMDGDASHVPLVWIQAVLDKLTEKLGDKRVYVLSVLGLQSSGKSTLLNTMFGVQFAVSTGRCTRGAFMQLLKVDSDTRDELGYDFLLIVDSEGLRSPELSTKTGLTHDNELATFIIGIGDMTVINIMGENPSEMQEILQICVQAFLRMKQVQFKPSCVFVHQNVAEASAGDNNMEGRRRLQEKLDEMARMAADEEEVDGVFSFSDIIKFDMETQVFYFKNLLEGDPPMAAPNPSYSQNVQELKSKLLSVTKWQTGRQFPLLSQFKSRVTDLWNALLKENFVFSFRNTMEMAVYSDLEDKYVQWSWELRKHTLETQNTMHNKIGSNLIQNVSYAELAKNFQEVYIQIKSNIETYFKENKNAEILVKWKANIEKRFESLKNELVEETHKKCQDLIAIKKCRLEQDRKRSKYEAELLQASKALASTLKEQQLNDSEVEGEFDKHWVKWITKVAGDQPPEEPVNVKAPLERVLLSRFKKQPDIMRKIDENEKFRFQKTKHVSLKERFMSWLLREENVEECAEELRNNVSQTANTYIREKENQQADFSENFIYELLTEIESSVAKYEEDESIKFTQEFRVDLSIDVCLRSVERFQKMHENFKKVSNPVTYLQSKRDQYLQMFKNYWKGASSVKIFASFLFKCMHPAIRQAVNDKTYLQIANAIKSENPAFSGNRLNLENHIMRHLANEENFKLFEQYIGQPKMYFERFIAEQVEKFCKDAKRLIEMLHENLEELKAYILCVSTEVCNEVNDKHGNASMWLDRFCKKLGGCMVIQRDDLKSIENEDICDVVFLKDMMAKSLEENAETENAEATDLIVRKVKEILFRQFGGCWAKCPFCKVVCTNTISGHSTKHNVMFHRSVALGHWKWHETDTFNVDFCSSLVSSDVLFSHDNNWTPYKSYQDAGDPFDKWSITAEGSEQRYWKWFICKFQKDWEKKCGLKFAGRGKIPEEWRKFNKDQVLSELK
ncbi:interferon-induced very large GTPase 1-like [Scleropages formosus]|uniref:Interferon-induced very large GTPase 1-like n=1 Tax=Scleropages formosus TaxID=113540 RepID=A0A8C9R0N6_SCLFO|nr:interferon-induced very large GTPase 1-like [Scleropages formosus]XP_018615275.2 interferon-induced very large GTPase 1-like [Scleropages formosus]XP_018615277.2 interferon-induced very large GTPase 1-like [Scleropages formosus]